MHGLGVCVEVWASLSFDQTLSRVCMKGSKHCIHVHIVHHDVFTRAVMLCTRLLKMEVWMCSRLSIEWRWFGVHFWVTIVMTADNMVEVSEAEQLALVNYMMKEMIDVVWRHILKHCVHNVKRKTFGNVKSSQVLEWAGTVDTVRCRVMACSFRYQV